MKNIYHFVYKTTNIKNGKYYIGAHSTHNLNDGYLGSGQLLKNSILKYGKENFHREILKFFNTREEAFNYEMIIITEKLIQNEDCYNMCTGGLGCSVKSEEFKRKVSNKLKGRVFTEEHRRKKSLAQMGSKNPMYGKVNPKVPVLFGENNGMYGKKHSNETKKLISENRKKVKVNITEQLRISYSAANKNKKWYNDGKVCKRFYEGQQPINFMKGRLNFK